MGRRANAGRPETVPVPEGFSVAFDADTQFVGPDVLFGGTPPRLMRLNAAGVRALAELRGGPVGSADAGRLARRLTDAGLAHPRPPAVLSSAESRPAQVSVVIIDQPTSSEVTEEAARHASQNWGSDQTDGTFTVFVKLCGCVAGWP